MKKIIKDITLCILAVALCFGSVACVFDDYPEYESGYFRYAVKTEKNGAKKAYIIGLTEIGLEQTALVYPEKLENIPVYGVGYKKPIIFGHVEIGNLESERLQKIYFPHMPKEETEGNMFFKNAYAVYWTPSEDYLYNRLTEMIYETSGRTIFGYNYVENDYQVKDYRSRLIGNVSYLYNYDGSPNEGYYWVDSYNESVITFIPPEPQRDGYKFDGWYKESECINEWDFTTDITGKEIVLKANKTYDTYEGIYLYAKWIEN